MLFNFVTWLFFLLSDDFISTTVNGKRIALEERALLFAKIAQPVLEDEELKDFRKGLQLRETLDDPRLIHQESVRIFRYDEEASILDSFLYFDGRKHLKSEIKVDELPAIGTEDVVPKKDIGTRIFEFLSPLTVKNLLTDPIVEVRLNSRYKQKLVIWGTIYFGLELSPIKSGRKTIGIVEAEESIDLGVYAKRNGFRLNIPIGLSGITFIFGALLAFSIVIPLRRLSRRLNEAHRTI